MKKLLFSVIAVVLFSAFGAFAQTPTQALDTFYKFHRARDTAFTAAGLKVLSRFFSADLNRLFQYELKREREFLKKNPTDKPYYGDGFPFVPFEECTKNGKLIPNLLTFANEKISGAKATVDARFSSPKHCGGAPLLTFKYTLVKVGGRWLIDDFADDEHTLKDDLNRPEY